VREIFERCGYTVRRCGRGRWIGRLLLVLGRRREGLVRLAEARTRRSSRSAGGGTHRGSTYREDPLSPAWLGAGAGWSSARAGRRRPRCAAAAVRAACAGDRLQADAWCSELAALAVGDDYAVDRCARAASRKRSSRAAQEIRRRGREEAHAVRLATEGGADADLVPALFQALARVDAVSSAPRDSLPSGNARRRRDAVLDGRIGVLQAGERRVSLQEVPAAPHLAARVVAQPERLAEQGRRGAAPVERALRAAPGARSRPTCIGLRRLLEGTG